MALLILNISQYYYADHTLQFTPKKGNNIDLFTRSKMQLSDSKNPVLGPI
jgi:hypothetical protein